jgi:orotate phosphoribosyltransferase
VTTPSPSLFLAHKLIDRGAYRTGDFTLASGKQATEYVDLKAFSTVPLHLSELARYLADRCLVPALAEAPAALEDDARAYPSVGLLGVPSGGAHLAAAACLNHFHNRGLQVPLVVDRGANKEHGLGGRFFHPGEQLPPHLILVEDVVTTGASCLRLAEDLSLLGSKVLAVLACVNRQDGASEALYKAGIKLYAVTDLDTIRAAAASRAEKGQT